MAIGIAPTLFVLFLCSHATAETELVVGHFYGFGMSTKDLELDDNANAGMAPEILTSPTGTSLIFWAFFGSGAQLRIVTPSGSVKWSSPCEQIQLNVSTSTYTDDGLISSSQGYRYGFNFNFTEQGELQVIVSGFVRWSSNTSGRGVVKAVLSYPGNDLVLLNATNTAVWQSQDHKSAALCPVMQEQFESAGATTIAMIELPMLLLLLLLL